MLQNRNAVTGERGYHNKFALARRPQPTQRAHTLFVVGNLSTVLSTVGLMTAAWRNIEIMSGAQKTCCTLTFLTPLWPKSYFTVVFSYGAVWFGAILQITTYTISNISRDDMVCIEPHDVDANRQVST